MSASTAFSGTNRARYARLRARRRERGAIVFIVAMTLAVLMSLGMFAMHSAQNEIRSSGFERQSVQTHYLSEYGVLAATNSLSGPSAEMLLGVMMASPDANCLALASVPASGSSGLSRACRRLSSAELATGWSATPLEPYQPTIRAGSLGPTSTAGAFFVEVTEPSQVQPPAGFDLSLNLCFMQFTLTSFGITQPDVNITGAMGGAGFYGSQGIEMSRARITAGPMRTGCK